MDGFTINGYIGSEAERYAGRYTLDFVAFNTPQETIDNKLYLSVSSITLKPGEVFDFKVTDSQGREVDKTDLTYILKNNNFAYLNSEKQIVALKNGVTTIGVKGAGTIRVTVDSSTWEFNENTGTLTIGGTDNMRNFYYDNEEDTSIPWNSFKNDIKCIDVDGVISIGSCAFWGCENLTDVIIGESVKKIGEEAFKKCNNIQSITIKGEVPSSEFSFDYCLNPFELRIKDLVIRYNDSDKEIAIDGEGQLDNNGNDIIWSLVDMEKVKSVVIGDKVTKLPNYFFNGLKSIEKVQVDTNNPSYSSFENNVYNKGITKLIDYSVVNGNDYFEVPDTVKVIGDYAFYDNLSLKKIKIPKSVVQISDNAFKTSDMTIIGYKDTSAELFAIDKGYEFECLEDIKETVLDNPTDSATNKPTEPTTTEPTQPVADKTAESTTTEPTEPKTVKPTEPAVTEPQPATPEPTAPVVEPSNNQKDNPVKITVKVKTVRLKKLKKKAKTIKAITIKGAQGKVSCKITKAAKIKKHLKINAKGVITFTAWKKAKQGTYKIKVTITVKGNSKYKPKTIKKTVKIKIR